MRRAISASRNAAPKVDATNTHEPDRHGGDRQSEIERARVVQIDAEGAGLVNPRKPLSPSVTENPPVRGSQALREASSA